MSYADTIDGNRGGRSVSRRTSGGSFATTTPTGRRGTSGSFGPAPATSAPSAPQLAPTLGTGGGGGGGMAQAIPMPAPVMSLEDYIQNNFMLKQAQQEAERGLEDFDAETMKMRQDTEAEQAQSMQGLERALADQSVENAGSFAARGLDRSGLVFQEQDRINERGEQGRSRIQQMLTDLLATRGQGRIQAERSNQGRINDRIAQITQEFNQRNMGQIGV